MIWKKKLVNNELYIQEIFNGIIYSSPLLESVFGTIKGSMSLLVLIFELFDLLESIDQLNKNKKKYC